MFLFLYSDFCAHRFDVETPSGGLLADVFVVYDYVQVLV